MSSDLIPLLNNLEPISALSPGRIKELADLCVVETVSKGLDPFRMNVAQSEQLLYLLQGELKLIFNDGKTRLLQGSTNDTRHPIATAPASVAEANAMSDIKILRVDADLLDIMLTWDQLAGYEKSRQDSQSPAGKWMQATSIFSAESLKEGIFRMLPVSNVEEMFHRMVEIKVQAGQTIIRQGEDGNFYYLIQNGRAEVLRDEPGGNETFVAVLEAGEAFGEEALVSGNKRNATIRMATDGVLLRLGKNDFIQLLKEPLLHQATRDEAMSRMRAGAQLLDVRTPSEFNLKHLMGAINMPLQNIREAMSQLKQEQEYLVYCQSGRRAAAATFILAQRGFKATVLLA